MKRLSSLLIILLTTVLVLQNCKHEIPEKPDPGPDPVPITRSDTCSFDTVYFVNDILPIILSNCAQSGCHDAITQEDGVRLTDYDNIINSGKIKAGRADDSDLYEMLTETDPKKVMPPPPASLTPEQINAIRVWINQGALNNACRNICDTTNVTYSKNIWPILERTCKGCHNGVNGNGGVSITSYSEIKGLVDIGRLDGVINHRSGFKPMPPPPGQLEDCAKNQIRIWIAAGAPNN